MPTTRIATACIALAAIAACGGASPEDQVRDTARHATEALLSDQPERVCQYMLDRDECVSSIATLKALDMDPAATAGIPDDWRDHLRRATIKVSGDTATLAGFDIDRDGKPGKYVLREGHWLADNR